jgi:hypothetical protein
MREAGYSYAKRGACELNCLTGAKQSILKPQTLKQQLINFMQRIETTSLADQAARQTSLADQAARQTSLADQAARQTSLADQAARQTCFACAKHPHKPHEDLI